MEVESLENWEASRHWKVHRASGRTGRGRTADVFPNWGNLPNAAIDVIR